MIAQNHYQRGWMVVRFNMEADREADIGRDKGEVPDIVVPAMGADVWYDVRE